MAGRLPWAARSPAATPALAIRQPVTFPGTSQADAGTARATRRRAAWPARHASGEAARTDTGISWAVMFEGIAIRSENKLPSS